MIEGPEEINPDHLAKDARAELLLRDPSSFIRNDDGSMTSIVPDTQWLQWNPVPLVADPSNCEHGFSVCPECANDWGQDYYIKFFFKGDRVWISPDHPDAPPDEGNPPIYSLE